MTLTWLDNDTLTISTTSEKESSEENALFMRKEFDYASFQRSFRIPETIVTKNIKANYKNGLLSIELPKRKEAILEPKKQIKNQLSKKPAPGWFFYFTICDFFAEGTFSLLLGIGFTFA